MPGDWPGRDALYLLQQLGQRHSAVAAPLALGWRTTRQPKRMLSNVDDSVSSSEAGGGVAPHPQHAGWVRISVMKSDVSLGLPIDNGP